MKAEESLAKPIIQTIFQHYGEEKVKETLSQMSGMKNKDIFSNPNETISVMAFLFFIKKDDNEKTIADNWEKDGWIGLKNDQVMIMRYFKHSYPTLLDVQKIIDDQSVENSMAFAAALQKCRVPFELHIYQKGGHGLGVNAKFERGRECIRWIRTVCAG